jgi:hypothetical protein
MYSAFSNLNGKHGKKMQNTMACTKAYVNKKQRQGNEERTPLKTFQEHDYSIGKAAVLVLFILCTTSKTLYIFLLVRLILIRVLPVAGSTLIKQMSYVAFDACFWKAVGCATGT